ncbi:AAA family ATPase [Janthinobacterium sp. SUN033]|uniref:AAA family ATPase n=1 Tax=Janthinobacterium sp. SUN033 TaxID=3002439 RepID=UPI0025B1E83F|nr:AAA family ATPase [Janthinobacterium sp. SUN033]MDN2679465.1 AAA family ATPase [Janthinobacterium sp. SUN033]
MSTKPSIIINQLILVGHRKNYVTQFNRGVNIIYGDSATGKSSILELINYALGAKNFIYEREIETSVKYLAIELSLNNITYVIKRDIFQPQKHVEVYQSTFDTLDTVYPKLLAADFSSSSAPDGYLSDFLLSALNLPILKVKEAPSKVESSMVRLSFRDLFKYNYLKQDDVGSKGFLGNGNWPLSNKNKQTFKYIFNLLDSNITGLEDELGRVTAQKNKLDSKYDSISEFLRETRFESSIELLDSRDELTRQVTILQENLSLINRSIVSDNQSYAYLKEKLVEISLGIKLNDLHTERSMAAIERFSRLKNDYQIDVDKIKSIVEAKALIGDAAQSTFPCPICENTVHLNEINEEYQIDESKNATHEINSINRRIKDINLLIQQERDKLSIAKSEMLVLKEDEEKARRLLDVETSQIITPYLSERDGISSELATVKEKLRQVEDSAKIRRQHKLLFDEATSLGERIVNLTTKLNEMRKLAPSLEEVLSTLGDLLSSYLEIVNIKDRRDISISKSTLLPVLRNRDYGDITSGGLRTILSIGYLSILFNLTLRRDMNLPAFLMVDTVGKYLGKTQSKYNETDLKEDTKEGVSDPTKYKNMYSYMLSLAEAAEDLNIPCQILLVDNDVPVDVQRDYSGFTVAHFSSRGENGLPLGLIDDAHLHQ